MLQFHSKFRIYPNADALGALEYLRQLSFINLKKKQNFIRPEHQKCMERFSKTTNEKTSFYPLSPYGVAKLYAHG